MKPGRDHGKGVLVPLFASAILLALAGPARAMHISEGILPLGWAILWNGAALPFIAVGLWRLKRLSRDDYSFKPLVGLLAAAVFIISCIPVPVPVAGTCSHPCGTAISAILLGPFISVVVAAVALIIQALFLAHGGLSTLGANVVSMGVVGSFSGFIVFRLLRMAKASLPLAGFAAGVVADWATYLTTSFILACAIRGKDPVAPLMAKIVAAFVPTQLPLGVLEGAMTGGMVVLLYRKRPDLLIKMKVLKAEEVHP
jgi:cobalt/nickel transport system permease protein